MKKLLPLLLGFILLLTGCQWGPAITEGTGAADPTVQLPAGAPAQSANPTATDPETAGDATAAAGTLSERADMFTDRDYEVGYDESTSVLIQLNGDSITCDSPSVRIDGTTAVLSKEGTYILSGTLNDGMIVVNAGEKDKLQLVLKNANITNSTSAPLYILEADKVFVTLAADTDNTLSNGGTFTAVDENNIDAALFSKQDLTLNGSGTLTVISPAGHGIVSKDDLVLTSGAYTVKSASHGLQANDSVRIANASLIIEAGKDGIHAENSDDASLGFVYIASGTLDIIAQGDGISAGATLQIEDGAFDIETGGGSANAQKQHSDTWGGFGGGRGGRGGFGGDRSQKIPSTPGEEDPDEAGGDPPPDMPHADKSDEKPGDSRPAALPSFPSGEAEDEAGSDSSTSIKGLKSSGNMVISGGNFTLNCADDAVHANASITVTGGIFEIATGDDGFHADDTLTIHDGTIRITESYEGLEALHLAISGGDITLVATDDGLNAAGGTDSSGFGGFRGNDRFGGGRGGMGGPGGGGSSDGTIVISGGTLNITASGDGIDSNGSLTISGGHTTVCGPTQGDTATLDYDTSGVITGGTFIGTGASHMAQTFSDSEQGVISLNVGNQAAGTTITLQDKAGNTLISRTPELPFAVVILSTPDMTSGETYTVTIGEESMELEAR